MTASDKLRPVANACVASIAPYKGGESSAEAVKLSSNENPYGPSPAALKAFTDSAAGLARYPDGTAAALRAALAEKHGFDAEGIVCGAGSDELIALLCCSYLSAGDTVVQSRHGFLMYAISAKRCGAETVYVPERDLRADPQALAAASHDPSVKILFLANPNNPTGTYLSRDELERLLERVPSHVIVALDNAYAEYADAPDYSPCHDLIARHPNLVCLHTFSKIHGLASLRVGYGLMDPSVADVLNRARGPFNVCAPGLAAAIAAARDAAYEAEMKALNLRVRAALTQGLESAGFACVPSQANFVLASAGSVERARALFEHLRLGGFIARPVESYGLGAYLRITAGTEEQNKGLLDVLASFPSGGAGAA